MAVVNQFSQEIYKTYTAQITKLGTPLQMPDGRLYRFALNGAANVAAARLCQAGAVNVANHANCTIQAANNVGDYLVSITLGATSVAANEYADGYLFVNDAGADTTTEGFLLRIKSHPAASASGTLVVTLYEDSPVVIAMTTNTQVTLYHPDYYATIIHPSPPTAPLAGVTSVAVLANAYYWAQRKGPCCVLTEGTLVQGRSVMPSSTTDGAVTPTIYTEGTPNVEILKSIGEVMALSATTEESLVWLQLE